MTQVYVAVATSGDLAWGYTEAESYEDAYQKIRQHQIENECDDFESIKLADVSINDVPERLVIK